MVNERCVRTLLFTSPRVRGEVGERSEPGEGDSQLVRLKKLPLTPTLSP
jgi:hypothetical protein